MRLVPGMKMDDAVAALKAHLAKRGYGDIEVNVSGGYDSTSTPVDARLIQAQLALLRRNGLDPLLWPRLAGSYPGYVFTDPPLGLASGHFGLGHGGRSEEHTSELQSLMRISYAVFCLKKKKTDKKRANTTRHRQYQE